MVILIKVIKVKTGNLNVLRDIMMDAHCHLNSPKFSKDITEVIKRAKKEINGIVTSAVSIEGLLKSLELRKDYPDFIHVTAGIYPAHTANIGERELEEHINHIIELKKEIVAIGEIGPDFHRIRDEKGRGKQLKVLADFLNLAEELNLPLVVHARESEREALNVVKNSNVNVIFHCFSGDEKTAREISESGFFLSIPTLVCYVRHYQDLVKNIPLENLILETDSPCLSPFRNIRRNEPVFLKEAVKKVAELLEIPFEKISEITEENTIQAYNIVYTKGL